MDSQNLSQRQDIMISQLNAVPDKKSQCEKHGSYPLKKIENPYDGSISYRGECQKCLEEKRQEELRNRTTATIQGLMKCSGIPQRFLPYTFDDFNTGSHEGKKQALQSIKDYVRDFDSNKAKGRSMVWCGPPGTGKTMLACCLVKEVIRKTYCNYERDETSGRQELKNREVMAHYRTEYSLIRKIKNTWKNSGPSEQMVINDFCELDLLVIDELGISFGSEADKILLYQVINGRYERSLPTVLISNLNHEDLTKHCGVRIMDRMKENGGLELLFNWDSYRR